MQRTLATISSSLATSRMSMAFTISDSRGQGWRIWFTVKRVCFSARKTVFHGRRCLGLVFLWSRTTTVVDIDWKEARAVHPKDSERSTLGMLAWESYFMLSSQDPLVVWVRKTSKRRWVGVSRSSCDCRSNSGHFASVDLLSAVETMSSLLSSFSWLISREISCFSRKCRQTSLETRARTPHQS